MFKKKFANVWVLKATSLLAEDPIVAMELVTRANELLAKAEVIEDTAGELFRDYR